MLCPGAIIEHSRGSPICITSRWTGWRFIFAKDFQNKRFHGTIPIMGGEGVTWKFHGYFNGLYSLRMVWYLNIRKNTFSKVLTSWTKEGDLTAVPAQPDGRQNLVLCFPVFSSEFWLEKNCVRVLMFGWSLTSQTISFSGTIYITQLIYPDWGLTKSTVTFWLKTLRLPLLATPLLLWRSLRMLIMWWSFQLNQKTTKWIKSCRVPIPVSLDLKV